MRRRSQTFRWIRNQEEDPLSSMANLVDVMLVFACGLLVALVAYLQLDALLQQDLTMEEKRKIIENLTHMQEIESLKTMNAESLSAQNDGSGLEEMGKVFRDPKSGKLLMIENE